MFFVSDRHDLKQKRISQTLVREPMIAVLLAAANVEWTIGRCILVLGRSPTVDLRKRLNETHGLKQYKALWKEELQSGDATIPGLAYVVKNWDAFRSAFELRHTLIHGRSTCSRNMASEPVTRMLQAATDLYEFSASRGKDLNARLPTRRKKKLQTAPMLLSIQMRASEAARAVDQANAIYSVVFLVFSEFSGFSDPKWHFRLQTQFNLSGLVPFDAATAADNVTAGMHEVAFNRLPRLLCISLVSTVEACLEDIAFLKLMTRTDMTSEQAQHAAVKRMKGGPQDYLPRLAELGFLFLLEPRWQELRELVATRNVLVHASELKADHCYVTQAGSFARVSAGECLTVDNDYLISQYISCRAMLNNFFRNENGDGA